MLEFGEKGTFLHVGGNVYWYSHNVEQCEHSSVVVQSLSRLTLWDPRDCTMPGFLVLHFFLEFVQTHVHWVSDAIQSSHPLSLVFPSIRIFSNESALCIRWPQYGASASASDLPMNIQSWFPLGLTGLIPLLSKGLLRVFFSTIVWKQQFFGTQPSLWSNSHIHRWLLQKSHLWLYGPLLAKCIP